MKKTWIIIALAVAFTTAPAQFDNTGTSAATFLKIGVGARAMAMGGAQVASVNDALAMYWNPSGLANLGVNQIMMSNNNWIADLNHAFFAGAFPAGDLGVFGVSVSYLSMGDMKVTTWDETYGTGETFSAYDAAIGIAWGRRISDRFLVGLQVKYITETISNTSANTVALDVGSQYDIGWLRVGMAILNFGSQMRLQGRQLQTRLDPLPEVGSNPPDVTMNLETQEWSLPILFQMGVSLTPYRNDYFRVTTAVDYRDERDARPQTMLGIEVAVDEMIFLRGGVKNRIISTVNGGTIDIEEAYLPAGGIGAAYTIPGTSVMVHFDYAYQQLKYFKNSQLITVGLDF
jgi:hypothetical protein